MERRRSRLCQHTIQIATTKPQYNAKKKKYRNRKTSIGSVLQNLLSIYYEIVITVAKLQNKM